MYSISFKGIFDRFLQSAQPEFDYTSPHFFKDNIDSAKRAQTFDLLLNLFSEIRAQQSKNRDFTSTSIPTGTAVGNPDRCDLQLSLSRLTLKQLDYGLVQTGPRYQQVWDNLISSLDTRNDYLDSDFAASNPIYASQFNQFSGTALPVRFQDVEENSDVCDVKKELSITYMNCRATLYFL